MIVLVTKKDFEKNIEKFAELKDYKVFDATNEDGNGLEKHTKDVTGRIPLGIFCLPGVCYMKTDFDNEKEFDIDNLEFNIDDFEKEFELTDDDAAWKKYKKTKEFKGAILAIFEGYTEVSNGNENYFIVMKKKQYKYMASKIKEAMYDIMDINPNECECVYLYDKLGLDKKKLQGGLKPKKLEYLKEKVTFAKKSIKLKEK